MTEGVIVVDANFTILLLRREKLGKRDKLDRHMKILWVSCTVRGFCAVQDLTFSLEKHMRVGQRGQGRE